MCGCITEFASELILGKQMDRGMQEPIHFVFGIEGNLLKVNPSSPVI